MQSAATGFARIFPSCRTGRSPDRSYSFSYVSEEQVVPQEEFAAGQAGYFIISITQLRNHEA